MNGADGYAWFTMNKEVTVTGMQMKTTVGSNLLIADTPDDADFEKSLSQSRKALLEPVSTVDGLAYFYTVNAGANGDALAEVYTPYSESTALSNTPANKTKYDTDFQTAYAIKGSGSEGAFVADQDFNPAYGYVDYNFYLKATNTDAGNAGTVAMTKCNLLYDNKAVTDKAWRVAMFVEELGTTVKAGTELGKSGAGTLKSILTLSGSENQTAGKAVDSATSATGSVTYNAAPNVDTALTTGTAKYYYVVLRVWLEGEDKDCTSQTYANLTDTYSLDLEFSMNGGNSGTKTAVTNIGSVANP